MSIIKQNQIDYEEMIMCCKCHILPVLPKVEPFAFNEDLLFGNPVQVQCFVSVGDLPLDILWLVEGEQVQAHREGITVTKLGYRSSILMIDSLQAAHSGNYTCLARNPVGASNYTAQLMVLGRQ